MNPRTNFSEADATTLRGYVELFRRVGDSFRFPADTRDDDHRELRSRLRPQDGDSTVTVTGIDMPDALATVREALVDIGFDILEETASTESHEAIGEYNVSRVTAHVPSDTDASWNKPTMVFYGSLRPELEEAVYAAFGTGVEAYNIRNHVAVRGERIDESALTTLSSRVTRGNGFFEDDARFISSNINTGTVA